MREQFRRDPFWPLLSLPRNEEEGEGGGGGTLGSSFSMGYFHCFPFSAALFSTVLRSAWRRRLSTNAAGAKQTTTSNPFFGLNFKADLANFRSEVRRLPCLSLVDLPLLPRWH